MTPAERQTLLVVTAMAEAIRDLTATSPLKGVPAGELYARVMPTGITHDAFERVISILVSAKLVTRKSHLLSWIGPTLERRPAAPSVPQEPRVG